MDTILADCNPAVDVAPAKAFGVEERHLLFWFEKCLGGVSGCSIRWLRAEDRRG